ncbi:hypothetical protein PCANC_15400 [Puccinia coronata f. sp. avenae]|uniref:Tryptophan--tRNA ligase, mitochondrial n=1 Tax=Puccinia coronata f. sp. avenae TaxID=200324 RepID=A0A2N5SWJ1_9BASI|nr:hypothetical protein PCANC_15400 [Puccinia coronata f. sp. avenae]
MARIPTGLPLCITTATRSSAKPCGITIQRGKWKSTATNAAALKPHENRQVIFSGIQPTGVPHIGNYIGALQNWLRLQELKKESKSDMDLYYSIVGLHAITLPRDPAQLRKERFEMMCVLLAIGLDPAHCCLFNQDEVPAHSEMAWILNCIAPVGRLNRMTTWKSQLATSTNANSLSEVDDSMLHLGLLAYPVLQSADILLYKSTHVPVGEDQTQHLELTKVLAKTLNKKSKNKSLFPLPQGIYSQQSKILNLRNPTMKMSKSHPSELTKIMITDGALEMSRKIKSAVTDSISEIRYDVEARPGVSNLLGIYQSISGEELAQVERRFEGKMVADLKAELADLLIEHFKPFHTQFHTLLNARQDVEKIYRAGAQKAAAVANLSLAQVKQLFGLG